MPLLKYDRESKIQRAMQKCVHFTGILNKTCKVGVCYRDVFDIKNMPCLGESPMRTLPLATCEKKKLPTREDVEKDIDERGKSFKNTMVVRKAIVARIGETKQNTGTLTCPICESGTVAYVRHSNGHIHARCSTDGCVAWME